MSIRSYDVNEIATRYSNALLLAVKDETEIDEVNKDFKNLTDLVRNNNDLKNLFKSPLINTFKKIKCIKKICSKASYKKKFINFLITVASHGKISMIEKIFDKFKETIDKKKGIIKVKITTATPLDKSLEKKLVSSLQAQLSQKIQLNKIVNKNIIGGIIIQIKSIMIDQSILTRLSNFNLSMKG